MRPLATAGEVVVRGDEEAIKIHGEMRRRIGVLQLTPRLRRLRMRGYVTTPVPVPVPATGNPVPDAIAQAKTNAEHNGDDEKSQHLSSTFSARGTITPTIGARS